MMKLRIALGVVVVVVVALMGVFAAARFFSTDRQVASEVAAPAAQAATAIPPGTASPYPPLPRPPPGPPIPGGDKVTLEEARRRTPYTIPIPPRSAAGADIEEIWATEEDTRPEAKMVRIVYSNGLEIAVYAREEELDLHKPSLVDDVFSTTTVRGIKASGTDAFVDRIDLGEGEFATYNVPGSVSWWVNDVIITLYHPTLTLRELEKIAEAMSDPIWPSNQPGATPRGSTGNTGN